MSQTVLLITDDVETGRLWAHALTQRDIRTVMAASAGEALTLKQTHVVDLVIIYKQSMQFDALALLRTLRGEGVLPLLLFTTKSDVEYMLEAYALGADECTPLPILPKMFLAKVQAWMRHAWTFPVESLQTLKIGPVQLDGAQREVVTPTGQAVKLTNLEFRTLHILMTHYGHVVSTDILIERVWGYTATDATNLVKQVIYRLRQKIEPDPGHPRYILQIAGAGYMFRTGVTGLLHTPTA